MGHQQKMLLISSLFIIGMGVYAGIDKFNSSSATANLNSLMIDLYYIAGKAQEYYHKPKDLMGGGQSFRGLNGDNGFDKLFIKPQNENGIFEIVSATDECLTINAIGQQDNDDDGKKLTVQINIYSNNVKTEILSR